MYERILVAIDGSHISTSALDEAIQLARVTGGKLCLVHVWDASNFATGFETGSAYLEEVVPFARKAAEHIAEEGRRRATAGAIPAETVVLERIGKRVADLVIEQSNSWSADLIVVGTHVRSNINRLLMGSNAECILRESPLPVLLVRMPAKVASRGTP